MSGVRSDTGESAILSDRAHACLKGDILSGALKPGAKLQLDAVSSRYEIGTAPMREALNRLSSEGWVERRSQRGFFVADLSLEELEELVKTRIWLEDRALRESISHAGQDWEDRVILSFHRLSRTRRFNTARDGTTEFNPEWETRHHDFHTALLSACGSRILLDFCVQMMERSVRHRNLSLKLNLARRGDALAEHEEILNATLDLDADRAVRLLSDHYRLTLDGLRQRRDWGGDRR